MAGNRARIDRRLAIAPATVAEQPTDAVVVFRDAWGAVTKHYDGDDSDVKPLIAAVLSAHEAITVEEHASRVLAFFHDAKHPILGRLYRACGYRRPTAATPRARRSSNILNITPQRSI